ncbi:MAG: hypothetical protein KC912_21020 [Proteobacteria bacterium]|nr:hypothetical protein [Pseudomonadota bacterium]
MRALPILTALLLTACGLSEEKYESKFAESYCEYALECFESPVLEFNGWTDMDTCVPDFGGRFADSSTGCIYDPKAAKDCLKALKKHPCSEAPDMPATCDLAFVCGDGTDDSGL